MLVINPDECIDCGVCEPECPVEAIVPDTDKRADPWLKLNHEYSQKWPNLTQKKQEMEKAEYWKDVPNKFQQFFSPEPGTGDE